MQHCKHNKECHNNYQAKDIIKTATYIDQLDQLECLYLKLGPEERVSVTTVHLYGYLEWWLGISTAYI